MSGIFYRTDDPVSMVVVRDAMRSCRILKSSSTNGSADRLAVSIVIRIRSTLHMFLGCSGRVRGGERVSQ